MAVGTQRGCRQGDLLEGKAIEFLGLQVELDDGRCAVVITHDCDLDADRQAYAEVIIGRIVDKRDNQYARCRHPRKLHLQYNVNEESEEALDVEIDCLDLQRVEMKVFLEAIESGSVRTLCNAEKLALRQWLAARYSRPAFPNEFERRMRSLGSGGGKNTVEKMVQKIASRSAEQLIGVFFDLGEDRNVELDASVPYELSISLVYDAAEGGVEAKAAAEKAAIELRELFDEVFPQAKESGRIELLSCEAVADIKFTLADLRRVDQWRLEHVSLRVDPPQNYHAAGDQVI